MCQKVVQCLVLCSKFTHASIASYCADRILTSYLPTQYSTTGQCEILSNELYMAICLIQINLPRQ